MERSEGQPKRDRLRSPFLGFRRKSTLPISDPAALHEAIASSPYPPVSEGIRELYERLDYDFYFVESALLVDNPIIKITIKTFSPRHLDRGDILRRDGISVTSGGTLTSITYQDGSGTFFATMNRLTETDYSSNTDRTTRYQWDGEIMRELHSSGATAVRTIGESARPNNFLVSVERNLGHTIPGNYQRFVGNR